MGQRGAKEIMPTSRAGTSSEEGFTLIEFAVVALILGIVFGLALPRIYAGLATDPLRADARRLAEAIRLLRLHAVVAGGPVRLRLRFSEGKGRMEGMSGAGQWLALADAPVEWRGLSEGVRLRKVQTAGAGEVTEGEAVLLFLPTGEARETRILLGAKNREERTLLIHPFLQRVEVHHGRLAAAR